MQNQNKARFIPPNVNEFMDIVPEIWNLATRSFGTVTVVNGYSENKKRKLYQQWPTFQLYTIALYRLTIIEVCKILYAGTNHKHNRYSLLLQVNYLLEGGADGKYVRDADLELIRNNLNEPNFKAKLETVQIFRDGFYAHRDSLGYSSLQPEKRQLPAINSILVRAVLEVCYENLYIFFTKFGNTSKLDRVSTISPDVLFILQLLMKSDDERS